MNLLITIHAERRTDHSSLVTALVAYLATFSSATLPSPARRFERTGRSGTTAVTMYEIALAEEHPADELTAAILKFVRDVQRRSGLVVGVEVLVGAPSGP